MKVYIKNYLDKKKIPLIHELTVLMSNKVLLNFFPI